MMSACPGDIFKHVPAPLATKAPAKAKAAKPVATSHSSGEHFDEEAELQKMTARLGT